MASRINSSVRRAHGPALASIAVSTWVALFLAVCSVSADASGTEPGSARRSAGDAGKPARSPRPPTPLLDPASAMLSFQGLLTDAGGDPLPGPTVGLEFNIYDGTGALVEGPIVLNGVPITGGIVDALVPVNPSSFDGSERQLGLTVDPPADELSPRISLTSVPYAFRVDRVASEELDDDIELGHPDAHGRLTLWDGFFDVRSIELTGGDHRLVTYGFDGLERSRLGGLNWGQLLLQDSVGNELTAKLSATSNSGGELILYDADGGLSVYANGDSSGGSLLLYNAIQDGTFQLSADEGDGGAILTLSDGKQVTIDIDASETPGGGGGISLFNGEGARTMLLDADSVDDSLVVLYDAGGDMAIQINSENASLAGEFSMYARDAANFLRETVEIVASDDGSGGAQIILRDGPTDTIRLDGSGGGGGAGVTLSNSAGTSTIVFDADAGDDGLFRLMDANGDIAIEMHADDPNSAGRISMYARDTGGTARETVEIIASEGDNGSGQSNNGAQIKLRKADGSDSITLDAEHGVGGDGRIITPVLQITGGADLSENFDIGGSIQPGYVVCIDARNPGKLVVSHTTYDHTVAGVISGANGVHPGMLMGQRGSEVDGGHPVALTGRVYVWADASDHAIQPGDLLTSSNTVGHAMKVIDYDRAHGAIIGKAMTALAEGKGLVLVLVTLQ